MKKLFITLALLVSAPAFSGNGLCRDSYLPKIFTSDSFQSVRAKLFTSGLFPLYVSNPTNVPEDARKAGIFEFSECLDSTAYKGCYASWITRSGDKLLIAFPADGRLPFLADCPSHMRH